MAIPRLKAPKRTEVAPVVGIPAGIERFDVDVPLVDASPEARDIRRSLESSARQIQEAEEFVGPPDLRSPEEITAAENEAFNAERARLRSPEAESARQMAEELRHNPRFALMSSGLDTAAFGLDDEIVAAGLTGMGELGLLDDEVDYRTLQQGLDEASALSAEEFPLASRAGSVGGILATLPLFGGGRAPATLAQGLRTAAVPTVAGATLGGVGGYLGADEGEELEGAIRGTAIGGTIGGVGGTGVALGRALSAGEQGLFRTLAGSGIEGTGYGLLATPGSSRYEITNADEMARAARENAETGALFGVAGGSLGSVFSRPARSLGGTAEAVRRPLRVDEAAGLSDDLDEAALVFGADDAEAIGPPIGGIDPRTAAEEAMRARRNQPLARRIVTDAFERDIPTMRTMSTGIVNRPDIRRAERGFGSLGGFVDALNEAGIAMPGTRYPVREARAGAAAAAPAAYGQLLSTHEAVAATRPRLSGAAIADDLDRVADDLLRGVPNPRMRQRAAALRARANEFRYGSGNEPQTFMQPVEDLDALPTLDVDPELVPVTELPPERFYEYEDIRRQMEREAEESPLSSLFRGATVEPTVDQLTAREVYRSLMNERNRAIRDVLGPEGYADYQRANRIARATSMVNEAPYERSQPADARGAWGRIGREGVGALLGTAQEQLIGQYQHSILASLNELGSASRGQVYQRAAEIALSAPNLPPATRRQLEAVASSRLDDAAASQAIRAARGASSDPAVIRAATLVTASDDMPWLLRRFRQIAAVDPAAAQRFALAVDQMASVGSLQAISADIRDDEARIVAEMARAEGETEAAPEETVDDRNRSFRERLAPSLAPSDVAEEAIPAPTEEDFASERNRSFRERLTRRGR